MKSFKFVMPLLIAGLGIFLFSCQKEDLVSANSSLVPRGADDASITYSANPSCLGEEVCVTFDNGSGSNCGHSRIQIWGPNDTEWVDFLGNTLPVDGLVSLCFTPAVEGTYRFRGSYQRTGSPASCPTSNENVSNFEDDPLEVEVCGCESSLTSALTCDDDTDCGRTVTYTFVPEEDGYVKIQGGLTNNTEICSMSATGGLTGVLRDSPNQANVTTWTGDVVACETYTITINWTRFASPSGDVAAEATGEWSAELNGVEVALTPALSCE